MTPFSHIPGDILTALDRARSFALDCDGPVSVLVTVPQGNGLPGYTFKRTYWHSCFEEAIS